jgi:hypothetical protein
MTQCLSGTLWRHLENFCDIARCTSAAVVSGVLAAGGCGNSSDDDFLHQSPRHIGFFPAPEDKDERLMPVPAIEGKMPHVPGRSHVANAERRFVGQDRSKSHIKNPKDS